ncbi:phage integrase family protein [Burkholderia pseudomallei]|nr:Phage integrase family domain protein [Burkholderia pseudomallei 1710b]AIS48655.1 phage integrase family protein [Burkholderia pseudomallei]
MSVIPNTQKRGNVYYFRRKVPVDLLSHYSVKVILASLGTTDYGTAKARAAELTAKTNREFSELRGHKSAEWQAPTRFHLPRKEVEHTEDWKHEYSANREHHKAVDAGERVARANTNKLLRVSSLPHVDQLAMSAFLAASHPAPQAKAASSRREVTRLDAPDHIKNLRHVVPSWTRRNSPKRESVGQAWRAIELFEEACGTVPLRALTKAHGAKFVAFLLDTDARGFVAKTAANHAALITALLNVAVKDDLIDRNPLDLTFDKTVGSKSREPWTDVQMRSIFGSALFSNDMGSVPEWVSVKPVDGRALLMILLHTGARIGEIAQLRRSDFLIHDGITAIRIAEEAGRVKTDSSERIVPLATNLLADPWFSSWLADVMSETRQDAAALVSMSGRKRGPSDAATKWFKAFRAHLELPSGRLHGSHKFRHWIRSAMSARDVSEATADAITGHAAEGSSGRVSYTHVPLQTMLAALDRLTYPAIGTK